MNETTEIFDYAPIMTRMEIYLRDIHKNFLEGRPNTELIDHLIVEARLLRAYNLHLLETKEKA